MVKKSPTDYPPRHLDPSEHLDRIITGRYGKHKAENLNHYTSRRAEELGVPLSIAEIKTMLANPQISEMLRILVPSRYVAEDHIRLYYLTVTRPAWTLRESKTDVQERLAALVNYWRETLHR